LTRENGFWLSTRSSLTVAGLRYGMQRLFVLAALVVALAAVIVAPALAASPGANGQPSQSCLNSTAPMEPGRAASAPANGAAVSQYDVACFQVSQPH
jgi:hypothetical protein